MMGLAYAAQGAWWPLLSVHLGELGLDSRQRAWIFAALPLSLLVAPLGVGWLADRFLPLRLCLMLGFGGSAAILGMIWLGQLEDFASLWVALFGFWLIAGPTMNLTNPMALRNLREPRREFAPIRVWGTIGWMVAGWVVGALLWASGGPVGAWAFGLGTLLTVMMVPVCALLPATPPLPTGQAPKVGLDVLLSDRAVLIYLGVAFGFSMTVPFMYQVVPNDLAARGLGGAEIVAALSCGQITEVAALYGLPILLRRLGDRGVLALGLFAWVLRYGTLASNPPLWLALAGIPLHGLAIACFSIAGQVYLDSRAPAHRRASVQALNVAVSSCGSLSGSLIAGEVILRSGGHYATAFAVAAAISALTLAVLGLGFRPNDR